MTETQERKRVRRKSGTSRPLRVLVLMHESLVPPDDISTLTEKQRLDLQTEWDVVHGIAGLGHDVVKVGVSDELAPLRRQVEEAKPDIVFNLLEEFGGQALYDHNVVAYLELLRMPYTGCNPRGLVLARDKALSKKILHYHRIMTPDFAVVPVARKFRRPARFEFPVIVKSLVEEASLGISKASLVTSDDKLAERIRFVHENLKTPAIVEKFIDGRELYVGLLGNARVTVFPIWELILEKAPPDEPWIATRRVKWNPEYQAKWGVVTREAKGLPDDVVKRIDRVSRRIYRLLSITGYARLDFRLGADGHPYFLEANPNPDVSKEGEFAGAAKSAGLPYRKLLERLLRLGLERVATMGEGS
jgi:D-alanine-D-alanine ligase